MYDWTIFLNPNQKETQDVWGCIHRNNQREMENSPSFNEKKKPKPHQPVTGFFYGDLFGLPTGKFKSDFGFANLLIIVWKSQRALSEPNGVFPGMGLSNRMARTNGFVCLLLKSAGKRSILPANQYQRWSRSHRSSVSGMGLSNRIARTNGFVCLLLTGASKRSILPANQYQRWSRSHRSSVSGMGFIVLAQQTIEQQQQSNNNNNHSSVVVVLVNVRAAASTAHFSTYKLPVRNSILNVFFLQLMSGHVFHAIGMVLRNIIDFLFNRKFMYRKSEEWLKWPKRER
jgi:hypothetical protein